MSSPHTKARLLALMEHANQIASQTSLDVLLDQMLALMLVVAGAQTGTLYLLDRETDELVFQVIHGPASSKRLLGKRIPKEKGIVGACITHRQAIVVEDLPSDRRWFRDLDPKTARQLRNAITFPLLLAGEPIGAVQVFNYQYLELEFLQTLGNRMASEIEKARLLDESRRLSARLQTLVHVMQRIGATLDRDPLLEQIIISTRNVLHTQGCALYLPHGEQFLRLHLMPFTNAPLREEVPADALPPVVPQVMATHQTITLRMKGSLDQPLPGAREVMASPLLAPTLSLGGLQGELPTQMLGVLLAYNKEDGRFTPRDRELLEALAQQAATVLEISDLYQIAQQLFLDTIESLVASIDAKDPYTQGHSKRVSLYSLAIGEQLGLSSSEMHQLRIGSLLHDIGKIGIPDAILKKGGPLTQEEFTLMQTHPTVGVNILKPVTHLEPMLPAIAEHHERLDGSGYPRGMKGEQISLLGRIVAVADVFDAMASDRPYRQAMDVEEVFQYLIEHSGRYFDPRCVQGLLNAYQQGAITPPTQMPIRTP